MADRSVAELPGMVSDLVGFVGDGRRQSVMDASLVVKDEFLAGPPRSGLSKNSSLKWGAGFNLKGANNPTALMKYRGPVHWTERGTDDHYVVASAHGRGRKSRVNKAKAGRLGPPTFRGSKAITTPYGPRASAFVRGQRARPFWRKVKTDSAAAAGKTMQAGLRRNIARAGFKSAARFR